MIIFEINPVNGWWEMMIFHTKLPSNVNVVNNRFIEKKILRNINVEFRDKEGLFASF